MRKLTLLALVMAVLTMGAFANQLEWDFDAEASASFGVDLDGAEFGFKNAQKVEMDIEIVAEHDEEELSEGDVYGYIIVEDVTLAFEDDDTASGTKDINDLKWQYGDVDAKVVLGPAYIDITDNSFDIDKASDGSKVKTSLYDSTKGTLDKNWNWKPGPEYAGIAIGVDVDMVDVKVKVGTPADWNGSTTTSAPYWMKTADVKTETTIGTLGTYSLVTKTTSDADNDYNALLFGVEAAVEVGDLTTKLLVTGANNIGSVDFLKNSSNSLGIGFSTEYDLAVGDLTLTPFVGVDAFLWELTKDKMVTGLEVGAGANLLWKDLGIDDEKKDFLGFKDVKTTSGVGFGVNYVLIPVTDTFSDTFIGAKLSFFEDDGDDGLLPILGGVAIVQFDTVLANDKSVSWKKARTDMAVGLELSADVDVAKPYVGVIAELYNIAAEKTHISGNAAQDVAFKVGVDLNVIDNTTFTLDYKSGDLANDLTLAPMKDDNGDNGTVYNNTATAIMGQLVFTTKIAF